MKNRNNITEFQNEYTLQKKANSQQKRKRIFRRRRICFIFLVAMILFTLPSIRLYNQYRDLTKNKVQQRQAEKEQKQLKASQKKLEKQVTLLQDDEYVSKLARSKYYYSKKNEEIYTVPEIQKPESNSEAANQQP